MPHDLSAQEDALTPRFLSSHAHDPVVVLPHSRVPSPLTCVVLRMTSHDRRDQDPTASTSPCSCLFECELRLTYPGATRFSQQAGELLG
jgi:hypothetical protein